MRWVTALESASDVIVGTGPAPAAAGGGTPLAALERAMLPALQRPPCVVSFSGGMDSSFLLAVAARVARREGLPLPIPVTWRFADAPRAYETPWQERVVRELGLRDWTVLETDDELDLVGPVAQRMLTRHGYLHPPNLHLHLPIVESAVGGALMTGVGGDQVLAGWRRPGRRTAVRTLRDRVPGRLVALRQQRRGMDARPWLRPAVSRQAAAALRAELRAEPHRLDRRIAWHGGRRRLLLTCAGLTALGADAGVAVVNPLVDPGFLASLAADVRGLPLTRAELLHRMAGDVLPEAATALRPKAHFLEVFLREPTREFVRTWDGSGVDTDVVDPDALRTAWSRWPIPGGTGALVQQLWLATASSKVAR